MNKVNIMAAIKSAILNLIELKFFRAYLTETAHFVSCLAIWYGFPDIAHIKVSNGRNSAILELIKLTFCLFKQ